MGLADKLTLELARWGDLVRQLELLVEDTERDMISRVPVIAGMSVVAVTSPAGTATAMRGVGIDAVAAQRGGIGASERGAHQKKKNQCV